MEAVERREHLYEVERRACTRAPGFRINEIQISPREGALHYHNNSRSVLRPAGPDRIFLRDPKEECVSGPARLLGRPKRLTRRQRRPSLRPSSAQGWANTTSSR